MPILFQAFVISTASLSAQMFPFAPGVPATEVLRKGLEDLHDLCEHVLHTFEASIHPPWRVCMADDSSDRRAPTKGHKKGCEARN